MLVSDFEEEFFYCYLLVSYRIGLTLFYASASIYSYLPRFYDGRSVGRYGAAYG